MKENNDEIEKQIMRNKFIWKIISQNKNESEHI